MKLFKPFEVCFSGLNLIEASAGTGKTYNIASLYIRAIVENRPISEILVVTYTNAAAKELRERLMSRIRDSIRTLNGAEVEDDEFLQDLQKETLNHDKAILKLKAAAHHFDEAAVYTIHGFCQNMLQEYAFESGAPFQAELIGDDEEIVQELVDDYWRNWVDEVSKEKLRHPLLKLMLQNGYAPNTLTKELTDYTGKPYLKVQPKDAFCSSSIEKKLNELAETHAEIKAAWDKNKDEIPDQLLADEVSGSRYRKGWLNGWMKTMERWLLSEVPPIKRFDKFSRFSQTYINDSLTKSS